MTHDTATVPIPLSTPSAKAPPVWIFALLSLPFAVVVNGFVNVALSYLLRTEGVPLDRIANELFLLAIPVSLYFLWSPVTDFLMRRRTWLVMASTLSAAGLFLSFYRHSFAGPGAEALLFLSVSVAMLVSASVGGLIAAFVSPAQRTQAGSMMQVGNLGGGVLGGGCILFLAQHCSWTTTSLACLALPIVPALAVIAIPEPRHVAAGTSFLETLKKIGAEFRQTFWSWKALPILLLLCAPFGSGAAVGLLPGLAVDFHVSPGEVVWMNGLAGGLLTAAGALAASLLPAKVDRRILYPAASLVNALMLAILCLGPTRLTTYLLGATLYLFTIGTCYALYSALIFDLMGAAGKSGSSRFAITNSLGNLPPLYMTWVDGRGYHFFGPRGLPGTEAAVGAAAAMAFLAWFFFKKSRQIPAMSQAMS